jgi:hypothetical protein
MPRTTRATPAWASSLPGPRGRPPGEESSVKWMSVYLLGYLIFMAGVFIALWKMDVLEEIGPTWTTVSVLVALGIGVMIAVSNSGRKENVEIKSK